jgi:hypothetical protein
MRTISLEDLNGLVRTVERLKLAASGYGSTEAADEYARLDLLLAILAAIRKETLSGRSLVLDYTVTARRSPPFSISPADHALARIAAVVGRPAPNPMTQTQAVLAAVAAYEAEAEGDGLADEPAGPLEVGRVPVERPGSGADSGETDTVDMRPTQDDVIDADFEPMTRASEGPLPPRLDDLVNQVVEHAASDGDPRRVKAMVDEACHWCQVALRGTIEGEDEHADRLVRELLRLAIDAKAGKPGAGAELKRRGDVFAGTELSRRDGEGEVST